MTLDVKNIHSVVHQKDKLFTVLNYSRNFGNAAKEGLKRATHRAVYHITDPNSWYPVPERARILTAIPAIVNRYHQYRWHHRAYRSWGTGHKQQWQELEFPRRTSIRELFSPTNRSASNALTVEEQQENSGKRDEEENGIFEHDFPSDDGDIPSLEREADFQLRRGSRFWRSIRFNSRIVFSQFFFISLVMELWDCRHLLCFMHSLTLLFVSLILTCLYLYVCPWSNFNGRKSLPCLERTLYLENF